MDKYLQILCKQNPETTIECGNPDCKNKITVNSEELFSNDIYTFRLKYSQTSVCLVFMLLIPGGFDVIHDVGKVLRRILHPV